MKPNEALALAEALIRAAREAIEDGRATLPADAISSDAQAALLELRAAIAAKR